MTTNTTIWHGGTPDLARLTAVGATSMPGFLGIEFVASSDDWLTARMPVSERTKQPYGRLHGGASVALAETVASVAAMATLDPAVSAAVGMEINANHLRPAGDGQAGHARVHLHQCGGGGGDGFDFFLVGGLGLK